MVTYQIRQEAVKSFIDRLRRDVENPALSFNPNNRAAIIRYMENRTDYVKEILMQSCNDMFVSLVEKDKALGEIEDMRDEIDSLQEEIDALRKEKAALENKFSDERMRNAYVLWTEITKAEQGDNSYIAQKKITAAGAIISAALGMQCYFGVKSNHQEDEK